MTRRRRRPTILDVARMAGVSRQTVSRVLNDSLSVAPETRRLVEEAIATLGYRPDAVARSLVTRRTHVLGVITRDLRYIHSSIIEGAEEYSRESGYQLFISGSEHSAHGEPLRSPLLTQQPIEGLFISYHGSVDDTFEILRAMDPNVPIVTIGYGEGLPRVTSIRIPQQEAAAALTGHLLRLGHREIAHITGPPWHKDAQSRLAGYRQALQEASLAGDPALVVAGDWQVASGYQAALRLLERRLTVTAIFCQNDWMAIGCLRALRDRGIRVPEDVALVGFDDIPPARYMEPPLTTVRYPGRELGRLCARVLIDRIEGKRISASRLPRRDLDTIEPRLVVRSSCGARSPALDTD